MFLTDQRSLCYSDLYRQQRKENLMENLEVGDLMKELEAQLFGDNPIEGE